MATNPLSYLLQSNTVPSPIEEYGIRNALTQIDSSIAALDDEITKTRLILAELERKHRLAAEEQATHLGVESLLYTHNKRELLQLSTVSGNSWRNAAFSTHKLWTVLKIVINQYVPYVENIGTEEILMDGLCRWVERSGSLPLNLSIQQYNHNYRSSGLILQAIQRLPAKHRWKEISLWDNNPSVFAFLFYGDHQMPWDSLELLDVDMTWCNSYLSYPEHPPISLQNATNLKRLKLKLPEESEHLSANFLHVPWAQLTELELIVCIPLADYLAILEKCLNLEVCEVGLTDNIHDPAPLAPLPSRLLLPKIRRLGMRKCTNNRIGPFLLSLELPNIDDLCIEGEDESDELLPEVTDTLLDFIDFSKCEILKLELQYTRDNDFQLYRLLSNIDSLTELRITSGEINGSLFDSLRARYGLLNNLEVLELTVLLFTTIFAPTRLAEFVDHCHNSPGSTGKLKSVSLNYGGTLPEEIYGQLEVKGVTFDITRL